MRSLKCQDDSCVHVCSEPLGYLADIWRLILLQLLLAWVAKIRSESKRPYLILGQLVFITVYVIAVTFSFALKITYREPTVQRAPLPKTKPFFNKTFMVLMLQKHSFLS